MVHPSVRYSACHRYLKHCIADTAEKIHSSFLLIVVILRYCTQVPLLEAGDIIIDGGNSEYQDTNRRCKSLAEKKLLFVGSGVSGGEEGARYGPSLMPGGHKQAW